MTELKYKIKKYEDKLSILYGGYGYFENFTDDINFVDTNSTFNYDHLLNFFIANYECIANAVKLLNIRTQVELCNTSDNFSELKHRYTNIDNQYISQCFSVNVILNGIFSNPFNYSGTNINEDFFINIENNLSDYLFKKNLNENNFKEELKRIISNILIHYKTSLIFTYSITSEDVQDSNFLGHIGNLIYIPSEENSTDISKGRFYCIQSFIRDYNSMKKRISYDTFLRYIQIYMCKFNTKFDPVKKNIELKNMNKHEYFECTWNKPYTFDIHNNVVEYYGTINFTNITVKILDDYEKIYSYMMLILCNAMTIFKTLNYICKIYTDKINLIEKIDYIDNYKDKYNYNNIISKNPTYIFIDFILNTEHVMFSISELITSIFGRDILYDINKIYNYMDVDEEINYCFQNISENIIKIQENIKYQLSTYVNNISKDYSGLIKSINYLMTMNKKSYIKYRNDLHNFKEELEKISKCNPDNYLEHDIPYITDILGESSTITYVYTVINCTILYILSENTDQLYNYFIGFISFLDMLKFNFSHKYIYTENNNYYDFFDTSYYYIINMINNISTKKKPRDVYVFRAGLTSELVVPNYICICTEEPCECNKKSTLKIDVFNMFVFAIIAYYKILNSYDYKFKTFIKRNMSTYKIVKYGKIIPKGYEYTYVWK